MISSTRMLWASACLLLVSSSALSQATPAPSKPPKKPPAAKTPENCAIVSGSVIAEAYGYKHVVTLRNTCDKPVECEVWTDVDPTPHHVLRAAPGESSDVITRIGSPASQVKADKQCRFSS